MKKAQELSSAIIIGIAIALILLFILGIIFFSQSRTAAKNLESCESKGGKCIEKCESPQIETPMFSCKDTAKKCCVDLGK